MAGNKTKQDMAKHEAILYDKNTYMNLYKTEDEVKKETMREQKGGEYVYDQVRHDYDETNKGYNQKDKRESLWSNQVKPRAEPKQVQGMPLTTTQVYGWRAPIDDMSLGFNRSGICKRTFHDNGHLS